MATIQEISEQIRNAGMMAAQQNKDLINGGKADNMADGEFDTMELAKGTSHEMEHTDNPEIAREIAKDHLVENPNYYTMLEQLEQKGVDVPTFNDLKAEPL